ncbi:MAG: hypothetical protein IJU41_07940, partial [Clostridia bacterium]|nr:hypothetical protein [Clostridia bacterium]
MFKRSLCNALVLCVFCALFALVSTAAAPTHLDTAPDGYTPICTAEDFVKLMHRTDGFTWDRNYILMADIPLDGREQAPIGSSGANFTGIFDGNNYTVRGLSLASKETGDVNLALFGRLNGTVRNLTVCGEVRAAGKRVGGIVGIMLGGSVENCVNRASVVGSANVGGIVGLAYSGNITVSGCTNEGNILGTLETFSVSTNIAGVGGIVGHIQNSNATVTVENCYNGGEVCGAEYIGGIVGYVYGADTDGGAPARVIARCQNAGKITATSTDRADLGGIVGLCAKVGGIYDCLNTGAVVIDAESCARPYAGGIVGRIYDYVKIANCYNAAAPAAAYTTETPDGVRAICGLPATRYGVNNFYTDGLGMHDFPDEPQGVPYTADKFALLNANGAWTVPTAPELRLFHTHIPAVHADGSYFCAACGETVAAPAASDLVISALPTTAEIGFNADVDIRLSSVKPMWGAAFEVAAPDGFTLTGVTPKITATEDSPLGASNTGFSLAADDTCGDPYKMAVLRLDGFSLPFEEAVIATLTFAVSDALSPGEYAIRLSPIEAYDAAGDPLSVTALGAGITLDVHAHILTPVAAISPTCTAAGRNAYYCCAVCDTCFADAEATVETTPDAEVVPATGHTPATLAAVSPTCTATGLTEGTGCAVCGVILVAQEVVPALGHTPVEIPAVPATYFSTGLTAGEKCAVCDAILVPQEAIPVLVAVRAVGMRTAAGAGVDLSALQEGDTFDVYITVPLSPGNTNQYYYRGYDLGSANKTFNAGNAKLAGETFTLGWTSTDLYVSNVEYVSARSSYATATSLDLAGEIDDTPLYYVFAATTPALSVGAPTVTGEGDATATALTIAYGSAFDGYMINLNKVSPKPDAPICGVIARVTFTAARESGAVQTITLCNSHTANGTPESYSAPSFTVTLERAAHVHELTAIPAV